MHSQRVSPFAILIHNKCATHLAPRNIVTKTISSLLMA